MEAMTSFTDTGIFLLIMIFSAAIFMCGFFDITRGEEDVLLDGRKVRRGKLLKNWYFFWHKIKGVEKIYASSELCDYYSKMIYNKVHFQNALYNLGDFGLYVKKSSHGHDVILLKIKSSDINDELLVNKISEYLENEDCIVSVEKLEGGGKSYHISCYHEKNEYVFPTWVRDIMAGCITCSATIYGNLYFWLVYLIANNSLYKYLLSWADNYNFALLGVWLTYYIGVSFVATFLYIRFNK